MNIIGIRLWKGLTWLICSGFPWFFAKIYAFQQGLSRAAGWGRWTLKWGLGLQRMQREHSLPTCPSLTPSSSWATVFSPPGSPGSTCLLETVNCALSRPFMPSFFLTCIQLTSAPITRCLKNITCHFYKICTYHWHYSNKILPYV